MKGGRPRQSTHEGNLDHPKAMLALACVHVPFGMAGAMKPGVMGAPVVGLDPLALLQDKASQPVVPRPYAPLPGMEVRPATNDCAHVLFPHVCR